MSILGASTEAQPAAVVGATVVGEVHLPAPVFKNLWEDSLASGDGYAYVARTDQGGLYVIDVRDPAEPEVVGELDG